MNALLPPHGVYAYLPLEFGEKNGWTVALAPSCFYQVEEFTRFFPRTPAAI